MQLFPFPSGLPIEAIDSVNSTLGTLIATLSDQGFFLCDDSFAGHHETVEYLREDLKTCHDMYDEWQFDPDAKHYTAALAKMDDYMQQIEILLAQAENLAVH